VRQHDELNYFSISQLLSGKQQGGGKEKDHWQLAKDAVAWGGIKSSTDSTDEATLSRTIEASTGFLCLAMGTTL